MDLKAAAGVATALGPTKEHRQQFGRTFIGTLLGQATVFLLMLIVYIGALVLLNRLAISDLRSLQVAVGEDWFWFLAIVPFICIILFSLVPTLWRAARERRLKEKLIAGEAQFNAGYFRLYPYDASDRGSFNRLDGAGVRIFNWIKSSPASLLYLSGASGVGKSSLLAADVLPQLRLDGWAVVQIRLFGDPMDRLRTALLEERELFARRPTPEVPLRALLERAAESRKSRREPPLILVIDQFEEFLILHRQERRALFAELLGDIAKTPIDGVRLLLVFRSDYRSLVFQLELPPLVAGQNWQELAPYGRGEATVFIQGGGRLLSPEALDDLFRGLDRIDGTPGLYRPITLNMVGFVLERMGRTLEGDPGQLVQRYLNDCLIASESRDFSKLLLTNMITDAGTKEARSEDELATFTRFQPWQIRASLADLAERGLVRRLEAEDAIWEISHDFLARIIGQLIGRTKPSPLQRARPFIAPAVLTGWIALTLLALSLGFHYAGPARITITGVQILDLDDQNRFLINVHYENTGGSATIDGNYRFEHEPIIVKNYLTGQEENKYFNQIVIPDTLEFPKEREIQPREKYFSTIFLRMVEILKKKLKMEIFFM
jgi:hypothetical protein